MVESVIDESTNLTVVQLFKDNGFSVWGGVWNFPIDLHHFQVPTDEAKKFLDEYIPVLQEREPIYEQWFLAPSDKKPALLSQEKEVIDDLLSPPIPVSVIGQEEFEEQFEIQSEISLPQKGKQVKLQKSEPSKIQPEPIKGVGEEEIEEQSEQKTKILEALSVFNNKIAGIGEHNSEAKKVALTLHENLINLVKEFLIFNIKQEFSNENIRRGFITQIRRSG